MEKPNLSVERIVPLRDRPALRDALCALWNADKDGWCCMTDGSCDDLSDGEAHSAIVSALDYIARENYQRTTDSYEIGS